jgi:N-acetylglutamate synthase-like GNAT family acetyltransferase
VKPTIRLANPDEAPHITALIERAYRGEESKSGWTSEADLLTGPRTSVPEIAAIMRDPLARFLVADADDGGLAGCALIRNEKGLGYFGMFAVRPDLQGSGIGDRLLTSAEQHLRDLWLLQAVYMTVINIRTDLIPYYERRGYKRTGDRKPFPFDIAPGATRTDFHLTVLRKALG